MASFASIVSDLDVLIASLKAKLTDDVWVEDPDDDLTLQEILDKSKETELPMVEFKQREPDLPIVEFKQREWKDLPDDVLSLIKGFVGDDHKREDSKRRYDICDTASRKTMTYAEMMQIPFMKGCILKTTDKMITLNEDYIRGLPKTTWGFMVHNTKKQFKKSEMPDLENRLMRIHTQVWERRCRIINQRDLETHYQRQIDGFTSLCGATLRCVDFKDTKKYFDCFNYWCESESYQEISPEEGVLMRWGHRMYPYQGCLNLKQGKYVISDENINHPNINFYNSLR
jgi:hypothetical protein